MTQQDEIIRITVNGNPVGIQGLKAVIADISSEYKKRSDSEVTEELLKRLGRKNYIPDEAKEKYGKAFLMEFNRHTGKSMDQEESEGTIIIKVLGQGCPQCDRLEMELYTILSETNIKADLEHIRDAGEIGKYGVMGTPALIINGEVKSVGSIPLRSKIIKWLKEA